MPRLKAQSPVGNVQEVANGCFSLFSRTSVSISSRIITRSAMEAMESELALEKIRISRGRNKEGDPGRGKGIGTNRRTRRVHGHSQGN